MSAYNYSTAIGTGDDGRCVLNIRGGLFKHLQGAPNCPAIGAGPGGVCDLSITGGEFLDIRPGSNCNTPVGEPNYISGTCNILIDTVGISNRRTGFVLSEGNIWIIAVGAAVIVLGTAAVIVTAKKKKKAVLADGERKSGE